MSMSDPIGQLLEAADASSRVPVEIPSGEIVARAKRIVKRRRRVRRVSGGVAMLAIAAVGAVLVRDGGKPTPEVVVTGPSVGEIQAMKREAAALREEAERGEQMVALMEREEKKLGRREERNIDVEGLVRGATGPLEELRLEEGRAASILVEAAERMLRKESRDPSRVGSAVAEYRRVLELFPETPAAEDARRRLREIKI